MFYQCSLENRTCTVCNNDEIEDEIHFLCVCPQLELIHQKYYETSNNLKSRFYHLDNESKFLYMSKNHLRILGNFIVELWNKRNNLLFRDCNDIQEKSHYCFNGLE